MCIGPRRLYEAMATLSFDHRINSPIDKTIIFTPYSRDEVEHSLGEFNIEYSNFEILSDDYFASLYALARWSQSNWYKQQAFKLCALDYFDSDYFLIQDCDLVLLKPYSVWDSDKLNFKAEPLWNDHQKVYAKMIQQIIGLDRKIPYSLVNELMPYKKTDWQALKEHIENVHGKNFLDAIADIKEFDSTNWFSEYELLGIWKTNQSLSWTYFVYPGQPKVESWEEFYAIDWSQFHTVKFHSPPLKHMNKAQAHEVIRFLNNVNS
jgi:hypothetical protein